jgi:hypothetical protein
MMPPAYKRPAALGAMPASRMPRRLKRPADESPLGGLERFVRNHFLAPKPAPTIRKPV